MFDFCESLSSLDVSNFDTSNVTDMCSMFFLCRSLTSLDVSHFNTLNVTDMSWMFYYCCVPILDVSHFDTSNVTNMNCMFYACFYVQSLDVSHFDTSNVTEMVGMFSQCESLTNLDVSNFDTSKCEETGSLFHYCPKLKSLTISPTMENIKENACDGVGWYEPCTLIAPEDFNFGVDTSGDSFVWKSGNFKLGATGIQGLLDFSQLPPYSHVEIFNTAGKMIKNYHIGDLPQALDLNGVGIGVFLVKINGVTYKIVRK